MTPAEKDFLDYLIKNRLYDDPVYKSHPHPTALRIKCGITNTGIYILISYTPYGSSCIRYVCGLCWQLKDWEELVSPWALDYSVCYECVHLSTPWRKWVPGIQVSQCKSCPVKTITKKIHRKKGFRCWQCYEIWMNKKIRHAVYGLVLGKDWHRKGILNIQWDNLTKLFNLK